MEKITEHFSFEEMSRTSHVDLQEENRAYAREKLPVLKDLCELLEQARKILGVPLIVTSAVRCQALNRKVGGGLKSQHLNGEAADFVPQGLEVWKAFKKLRNCKDFPVGQLVWEQSEPFGGKLTEWVHVSLGTPYRPAEKCGQSFKMKNGFLEKNLNFPVSQAEQARRDAVAADKDFLRKRRDTMRNINSYCSKCRMR